MENIITKKNAKRLGNVLMESADRLYEVEGEHADTAADLAVMLEDVAVFIEAGDYADAWSELQEAVGVAGKAGIAMPGITALLNAAG